MPYLTLSILEKPFSIHRLPADAIFPPELMGTPFFILTRSSEETLLILPEEINIHSREQDPNWVCIKASVLPHQDPAAVLAHISAVLAENGIQIYLTSGMEAHYILVRVEQLITAKKALENARCRFLKVQKQIPVETD